MPVKTRQSADVPASEFWEVLAEADRNHWVMTAACFQSSYGVVGGHAYTMHGVLDLQKDGRSYQKLVKMRNPWGREEYTGPWNDEDSKWTADFKR